MDFNLKDYLKKFENFLPFESKVKNAVIQSILEVVKIELDRKKIRVHDGSVFITGSSALKSEISMKQGKILARIKELQPSMNIQKIN